MDEGESVVQVDPRDLFLPPSRHEGADPGEHQRAVDRIGDSIEGMPPIELKTTTDNKYMIFDGVTRATRAAVLKREETVPAIIKAKSPTSLSSQQQLRILSAPRLIATHIHSKSTLRSNGAARVGNFTGVFPWRRPDGNGGRLGS